MRNMKSRFPQIENEKKLYESSKSIVYRANFKENSKTVILKILNSEYPKSEEIDQFRHEYNLISNIHASGVTKVFDLIENDNSFAIAFEDIGGKPLSETLKLRRLDFLEFLKLSIKITKAISQIHSFKIIHGNINPSNIIWNQKSGELTIIDFSNAFKTENKSKYDTDLVGKHLHYISPEQTGRVENSVDYRSDLYSLGVTLYEMLLGFVPFKSNDDLELIHSHMAKSIASPASIERYLNQYQIL